METPMLFIERIAGNPKLLLAISSYAALIGLIGAGIASLFALRKKIEQKEKRIREIIRQKTEALTNEIARLKKDNERLEILSSVAIHTESCVFITDENGEIEWANPGFTRKTGYTLEKFKKAKGNTIMEASCHPDIINIINEALQLKKSVTYESFAYTKYCRKFFISSLLTPIFNENGELKRFVIIDTDISKYVLLKDNMEKIAQEFTDYFQARIRKIA
jgi:PAS domain S-box-containing protein